MLRTLLESQATPTRRSGGTLVSVGVHTAVIALAIAGTARAVSPPAVDPPRRDTITYVTPTRPNDHRTRIPTTGQNRGPYVPLVKRVLIAPVKIPNQLPPIDFTRAPVDENTFGGPMKLADPSPDGGLSRRSIDDVYTRDLVEKAVAPLPGNPAPAYPAALRSAQIEGEVVARFVVDTAGRAEPASISFPAATHPQFSDAVRQALLRSRYLAAIVRGHPVRQLVEQRFAFTLTR